MTACSGVEIVAQAADAAAWLGKHPELARADIMATLQHLQDVGRRAPESLCDAATIDREFQESLWSPDIEGAVARGLHPSPGEIRVTRYLVWQVEGSRSKTATFDHALYATPHDPAHSLFHRSIPLRLRFTRQEVLGGVYEADGLAAGRAAPLVWLAEGDVHQAMLQGTVEVRLPDGATELFNVDQSNELPYVPGLPSAEQKRVWYFRGVDQVLGYGSGGDKIPLHAGAAVAGDVLALGVGRPILLNTPNGPRIVILADTGGAFEHNTFQLDLFAGAFNSVATMNSAWAELPDYVEARFLQAQ